MSEDTPPTAPEVDLADVLAGRGYRVLLVVAGLLGAPVALVAFGFLAGLTALEDWVWETLPHQLGWEEPAAWYAVLVLGVAGVLVGLVVAFLPGDGGHLPVKGLAGGAPSPRELPGVLLAAVAGLALGVVLGPEAPLTALGGGLVLVAFGRTRLAGSGQGMQLLVAAGSAAAVALVFGNPLVAVVLMLEAVGLAGRRVLAVMLPCLLSAGLGALVFTGMGNWTGLSVPSLTVPGLTTTRLDWEDLVWALPVAVLAGVAAQLARRLGLRIAAVGRGRGIAVTTAVGLVTGGCAVVYVLVTGRSVLDVLQSGESALPRLVGSPQSWPELTLLMLLVCKGVAYALCLGAFRGGPTFPAVFLGAALGLLVAPLPGLGTTAGVAIGMTAATTAVLRLPVTSVVLVVLLLGSPAVSQMPVIMLTAVVASVTAAALDRRPRAAATGDTGTRPAVPEQRASDEAGQPAPDPGGEPTPGPR